MGGPVASFFKVAAFPAVSVMATWWRITLTHGAFHSSPGLLTLKPTNLNVTAAMCFIVMLFLINNFRK